MLATLCLIVMFAVLIANIPSSFSQVFENYEREKYLEIDLTLTFDENAVARLINKRNIGVRYAQEVKHALSFFNLNVLAETDESFYYVELMSALPHEIERLIDYDFRYLSDMGCAVTESLAQTRRISEGDQLSIHMLDRIYQYTVIEIVPDKGLFSEAKIFVNKSQLIRDFYGLTLIDNIGNTLYLDLNDHIDPDVFAETLMADPEYGGYLLQKTIDQEKIRNLTTANMSIIAGVGLIITITMVIVMHSLFPLLTKKLRQPYAVIMTLGGHKRFMFHVFALGIGMGFVLSSVIGIGFALTITNISARAYGVQTWITMDIGATIIALVLVLCYLGFESVFQYRKITQESIVGLSRDLRYERHKFSPFVTVIAGILLIVCLLVRFIPLGYQAIVVLVLSFILAFQGISLALSLLHKFRKKPSVFRLFSLNYLKDNRTIFHSLQVLFASFLVIMIALTLHAYLYTELDRTREQISSDYLMMNIFGYQPSLKAEIMAYDSVQSVEEMFASRSASVQKIATQEEISFNFFVSMDPIQFVESFTLGLKAPISEEYLNGDTPYILLPNELSYILDIQVDDAIYLQVGEHRDIILVKIGGFFESTYYKLIYSNVSLVSEYAPIYQTNSLVIDAGGSEDLFQEMALRYGSSMYYIIKTNEFIDMFATQFEVAIRLFMVYVVAVVASFMIVIMNNNQLVFQSLKGDYAKLKSLGMKTTNFAANILKEAMVLTVIVLVFVIMEIFVFIEYLPKVMLVFHYYNEIIPRPATIMLAAAIVTAVYLLGQGYNLISIYKMKIIEEIKGE